MQRSAIDSPAAARIHAPSLVVSKKHSQSPTLRSALQPLRGDETSAPSAIALHGSGLTSRTAHAAPTAAAQTLPSLPTAASSVQQRPRAVALDITSDEQSSGEGSSDSSSSSSGSEAAALIAQFHKAMPSAPAPVLLAPSSSSLSAMETAAAVHVAADAVSKRAVREAVPIHMSAASEFASSRATPPPPVPVRVKVASGRGGAGMLMAGGGQALSPRAGRGDVGSLQRQRLRVGGGGGGGAEGSGAPLSMRGSANNK